nr:DNA topoisomerase I [Bacillus cereus]
MTDTISGFESKKNGEKFDTKLTYDVQKNVLRL